MSDAIQRIEQRYDPSFDTIPDGPRVTWAERALAQEIRTLRAEVEDLRNEIEGPTHGNPRCALCGRTVKQVKTGRGYAWMCTHCDIEDPPIKVNIETTSDVQNLCEWAMEAIATVGIERQVRWITYILEGLDEENGNQADVVLRYLQETIESRLALGQWESPDPR